MQLHGQPYLGLLEAVVHGPEILNNDGMLETRVPIELLLSEMAV